MEHCDSRTADFYDTFMLSVSRKIQYMEICESMYNFVLYHGNTTCGSRKKLNVGQIFVPVYYCLCTAVCAAGKLYFQKRQVSKQHLSGCIAGIVDSDSAGSGERSKRLCEGW